MQETSAITYVHIPHDEYIIMRNKITTYETETNRLRITINAKEEIIEEFKKSNAKFQDKIKNLEEKIKKQEEKITQLEDDIKELKKIILKEAIMS